MSFNLVLLMYLENNITWNLFFEIGEAGGVYVCVCTCVCVCVYVCVGVCVCVHVQECMYMYYFVFIKILLLSTLLIFCHKFVFPYLGKAPVRLVLRSLPGYAMCLCLFVMVYN